MSPLLIVGALVGIGFLLFKSGKPSTARAISKPTETEIDAFAVATGRIGVFVDRRNELMPINDLETIIQDARAQSPGISSADFFTFVAEDDMFYQPGSGTGTAPAPNWYPSPALYDEYVAWRTGV